MQSARSQRWNLRARSERALPDRILRLLPSLVLLLLGAGGCDLSAPTLLSVSGETGRITLTWAPADGAVEYEVQRSIAGAGRFLLVGRATGTSFEDASVVDDVAFDYRVVAVDAEDVRSAPSPSLTATAPSPAASQGLAVESCNALDDDENGQRDDGLLDVSSGVSVGVCTPEFVTCLNGHLRVLQAGRAPRGEICGNGLDDDCDGTADETATCPPDLAPPAVVHTDPADGAVGVVVNRSVLIGFSEPLDPASITPSTLRLLQGGQPVAAQVLVSDDRLYAEIRPSALLASSATYTISVDGISDPTGNVQAAPFTAAFDTSAGTRDTTAGRIERTVPATPAVDVPRNVVPMMIFDEPVRIRPDALRLDRENGYRFEPVAGRVRIEMQGRALSFVPDAPLVPGSTYVVRPGSGLADLSGNSVTPRPHAYTDEFTVSSEREPGRPRITGTSPPDGLVGAPPGTGIAVRFDQPIAEASVAGAIGVVVDGVLVPGSIVTSGANRILTFRPDVPLPEGAEVVAVVADSVAASSGQTLEHATSWRFTIGAAPTDPPTPVYTPGLFEPRVPPNVAFVWAFDQPLNWLSVEPRYVSLRDVSGKRRVDVDVIPSPDRASLVIRPVHPLRAGAQYYLEPWSGANDLTGRAAIRLYPRTLTVTGELDTEPPRVVHANPAPGSIGVPVNVWPRIEFDEPVVPTGTPLAELDRHETDGTVTTTAVPLEWTDSTVVTLGLDALLHPSTDYTLRLAGLADAAGHPAEPLAIDFRSGAGTPPEDNVAFMPGATISASSARYDGRVGWAFDEDPATAWCTDYGRDASSGDTPWIELDLPSPVDVDALLLKTANGSSSVDFTEGSVELYAGDGALLHTTGALVLDPPETRVVLDPPIHSVQRVRFIGLADQSHSRACLPDLRVEGRFLDPSISVPDSWAPELLSLAPADGAQGASVDTVIVAVFDEAIDPTSVTSKTLRLRSPGGARWIEYGGEIVVDGAVVQLRPEHALAPDATHTIVLDGLTDPAGNPFPTRSFTFTTGASPDRTAPRIVTVTPEPASTHVWRQAPISLTFDEPIDPATATSQRFGIYADGRRLDADVSLSLDGTQVVLDAAIPSESRVSVAMGRGVFDLSGNEAAPFAFSFTTASGLLDESPSIRALRPPPNATDVRPEAPIVLFPSEPLDPASLDGGIVVVVDGDAVAGRFEVADDESYVVFVPDAPYPGDAVVEVFVTSDTRTRAGVQLAQLKSTFTVASQDSGGTAIVETFSLGAQTTDVPRNLLLEIRYSAPLDPASVSTSRVKLEDAYGYAIPVDAVVTLLDDGRTVRLRPSSPLRPDTAYRLRAYPLGANGSPVATFSTIFSTSYEEITAAPFAVVAPETGTPGVPVNVEGQLFADQPMNLVSLVDGLSLQRDDGSIEPTHVLLSTSGRVARVRPFEPLRLGEQYTIVAAGVRDLADQAVGATQETFIVEAGPDVDPPALVSALPGDGAVEVGVATVPELRFDETVVPVPFGPEASLVVDADGFGPLPGVVTSGPGGDVLRFVPDRALPVHTTHRLEARAVRDLAGNTASFPATTFHTSLLPDDVAPRVVSVAPRDGSAGIATNSRLTIRLDEPVSMHGIETRVRLLTEGGPVPLAFERSYDGTGIRIAPIEPLAPLETHTLVVEGLEDLSDNPVDPPVEVRFTTGDAVDLEMPVIVAVSPPPSSNDVPTNARLRIELDRPIDEIAASETVWLDAPYGSTDPTFDVSLSEDMRVLELRPRQSLERDVAYRWKSGVLALSGARSTEPLGRLRTGRRTDDRPLTLVSTSPPPGAIDTPVNPRFALRFDEILDPTTYSDRMASLRSAHGGIPVELSFDGERVLVRPLSPLVRETSYTLRVAGIRDVVGHEAPPVEVGFSTGTGDEPGPNVAAIPGTAVTDMDGRAGTSLVDESTTSFWCTNWDRDTTAGVQPVVTMTLATPVTASAITVTNYGTVAADGQNFHSGIFDLIGEDGKTILSTGDVPVPPGEHTIALPSAVAGVHVVRFRGTADGGSRRACLREIALLGEIEDPLFSLPDVQAPTLLSTDPANGARGVPLSTSIRLTFSEPIDPTSADATTVETGLAGRFEVEGSMVVFHPDAPLLPGRLQSVTVKGLQDLAGNLMALPSQRITFETESAPGPDPFTLVHHTPTDAATDVDPGRAITLRFSAPVDPTSLFGDAIRLFAASERVTASHWVSADGRVVTLEADLPANAQIYVQVTRAVLDAIGREIVPADFSFGTASEVATASIVGVRPAASATDVDPRTAVTLFTNAPVDAATLGAGLHVSVDGVIVPGAAVALGDRRTVVFEPDAPPAPGAVVGVFVTSDLRSMDGVSFLPFESIFHIAPDPLDVPLVVVSRSPAPSAIGTPANALLEVRMNRAVEPVGALSDAILFARSGPILTGLPGSVSLVDGGRVFRYVADDPLAGDYHWHLDGLRAVDDGLPLDLVQGHVEALLPADGTAPVALATPPDDSTGVPLNVVFELEFDEPISPVWLGGDGVALRARGIEPMPLSVDASPDGRHVRLTPHRALDPLSVYLLDVRGFRDLAGLEMEPLSIRFTTGATSDAEPPRLLDAVPAPYAVDVPTTARVSLVFDERIVPGTAGGSPAVTLSSAQHGVVAAEVSQSADGRRIELRPLDPLPVRTWFTLHVLPVHDLAGNRLDVAPIQFRTGFAADTTGPSVVGVDPPDVQVAVPRNAGLRIRFDEPVQVPPGVEPVLVHDFERAVPIRLSWNDDRRTLVVHPEALLAPDRVHVLSVEGLTDWAGQPMAGRFHSAFATGRTTDVEPPRIEWSWPTYGSVGVPTNAAVRLSFDEALDPVSVEEVSVSFTSDWTGSALPGDLVQSADGRTLVFTPRDPLRPYTVYRLAIGAGLRDLAGNRHPNSASRSFETGAGPDDRAPMIRDWSPGDGATDVPANPVLRFVFDEPVETLGARVDLVLRGPEGDVPLDATWDRTGELVATPGRWLSASTEYSVLLSGPADLAGNPLVPFTGRFTTGHEPLAGGIVSQIPGEVTASTWGGRAIPYDPGVVFLPNRSWCSDTNDVPRDGVQPFVQLAWPTAVDVREVRFGTNVSATHPSRITSAGIELRSTDGALVYASGPIDFEPPGPVHVLPDVARDVASFRLSVISHGGGWSVCVPSIEIVGAAADPAFSMPDLTGPRLLDVVPAYGAVDVPIDSRVVLTFDEPLDPTSVSASSIRVTYYDGGTRSLDGSYRINGSVVTFVPDPPLPSNRSIDVYVSWSAEVRDLAGNRMSSSGRYWFQTGDSLDDVPPVLVSSTPADGATGVNPDAPVLLAFSEPLSAGTLYSKIHVTSGGRSDVVPWVRLLPGAREARIDPSILLAGPVSVSIAAGVTDLAGNPLAPLTLSFTAEPRPAANPPTVTAIRPPTASVQAPGTNLVVYLAAPIDPATVDAGLLVAEDGVLVDGTISLAAGPATLVFEPEQPFRDGAIVEVFVLPSLLSLSGTPAAEAYGWFSVEDPAVRAPVVTDRSTVDQWNQTDSRRFLAVRFSTPLDPSSVSLAGVLIDGTTATGGTVGLGPDGRTLIYRTAPGVLLPGFYFSVGLTGLQTADGRPVPDFAEVWYGRYDDVVAPTATTIAPGSTGSTVPRTATFDIHIGDRFDPTSVHAGTIRLIGPSGPVPIDAFDEIGSHDFSRIRITPHGPLLHDTPYTVVVDGVRDAGGNPAPAASADFLVAPAP